MRFNRSSATIASPTVEGVSLRALQYQVSIAQARQLPLQLSGSALLTVQGSSVSIAQARQLPLQHDFTGYRNGDSTSFNRSSATIASPTHIFTVMMARQSGKVSIAQARQLPLQHQHL